MSTKTPFLWYQEAEDTFNHLKDRFFITPILAHVDPTLWFVVKVNASDIGVGAVLSQRTDDSKLPCAFFSHKLSALERNYDVGNREILSIELVLEE